MKKLQLFGVIELVYSMITSVKEDQLENVFNKNEIVKTEGEILIHTSNGRVHRITAEDLLKIGIDTIEDVEDEK